MATFNIEKAKQAGWDDARIQGYLSAHPEYAPKPKYGSALDRLVLSFGTGEGRDKYLQDKGIAPENVNKPGLDLGDITSKVGGLLPTVGGIIGAIPGIGLGAGAGLPGGPVGSIAGAAAGGAATGAVGQTGGELARQSIGNIIGINKGFSGSEAGEASNVGAIAGAAQPVLGAVGGKYAEVMGKKPVALYNKALGITKATAGYLRKIGIDPQEFVDSGIKGSYNKIMTQANTAAEAAQATKAKMIEKASTQKVNVQPMLDKLDELTQEALNVGDKARANTVQALKESYTNRFQKELGGLETTVKQAEIYRKELSEAIGKKFANSNAALVDAQRKAMTSLKEGIESQIPNIGDVNQKIRVARQLYTLAQQAADAGRNNPSEISRILATVFGSGVGGSVGYAIGGPAVGIGTGLGIMGSLVGMNAAQSAAGRTIRGQAVQQALNLGNKVAPVAKPAAQYLLRKIIENK